MTEKTPHDRTGSEGAGSLAALFAPEPARSRLLALHAWHEEIAGLPLRLSEPAIGAMRMEWHREAVEAAFAEPPDVRRNPVIEGLASLRGVPGGPSAAELNAILDAHDADFDGRRFAGLQEMRAFADAGWGQVMVMAARLIDPHFDPGGALQAAGRAWGVSEMVRSFALRAGRGLALIPDDVLADTGLTDARLASGREPELARKALDPVIDAAETALAQARRDVRGLPAQYFPAWGPAALVSGVLRRSGRAGDPYRTPLTPSPLTRQLALVKASLTGRI